METDNYQLYQHHVNVMHNLHKILQILQEQLNY